MGCGLWNVVLTVLLLATKKMKKSKKFLDCLLTNEASCAIIKIQKRKGKPKMTTLCYTIINNLMAGLALHDIEARIPCFYHLSDASFENTEETIDVVIQCRDADVGFVKEMLAPFV